MLKDSMERGVQTTGRVIGGLCAMAIVATLVVGVPLAMLYAAVKVIRMAWGY